MSIIIMFQFDGSLKKLHITEPHSNTKLSRLPDVISCCGTAMQLLKQTGYHFQPANKNDADPYVIFPFSDDDDILLPCYDALRALVEISSCGSMCIQALSELVPIGQYDLSYIIDIVSIDN